MAKRVPLSLSTLQAPADRYTLERLIGSGITANVYLASDTKASNKRVAIKIIQLTIETETYVQEEYRVLKGYSDHPNLPTFYGVFKKRTDAGADEIWFVMEYCERGPVVDTVAGVIAGNRRMREEHIAFVLREVIKAAAHLHENQIIHRDIRASNILITNNGEIKLGDFGLSRQTEKNAEKRSTCIGSPCWMAPEVVSSDFMTSGGTPAGYNNRVDVWAIGITAIELADGKPPFAQIHPTRALFQIVRNPPPTVYRPANWSVTFNDFIAECLEKNPEYRPFMAELLEHPFFAVIPENDYHFTQEIKQLSIDFASVGRDKRDSECMVKKKSLKPSQAEPLEVMHVEDLAALDNITEDTILREVAARLKNGQFHTFVGDVLLILNPNEKHDIYNNEFHAKYNGKSRTDNAPHIYAVADSAYQDMLHHEETQHILFAGESYSGKTTSMIHFVEHLTYLGQCTKSNSGQLILQALSVIQAFTNASTPVNPNSTRCAHQMLVTFGSTGRVSGAVFSVYQLEKLRISSTDMTQSNFHIFYYLFDALEAEEKLDDYHLTGKRNTFRYLRIPTSKVKSSMRPRDNAQLSFKNFIKIQQNLLDLGIEQTHIDNIWKILAAVLLLGNLHFKDTDSNVAEIENVEVVNHVAKLLQVDEKKLEWALTNYCFVAEGTATKKQNTGDQARDARDALANTIYSRLVDWVVNLINYKLSVNRAMFGEKYQVSILDLFGFECHQRNNLEQLLINTLNEQLQFHYNQRVFAWEMMEQQEEHVPSTVFSFYDNRIVVDELLGKPHGVLASVDEATRGHETYPQIINSLRQLYKSTHVRITNDREFQVSHYTGIVTYNAKEMAEKNKDFLPPEITGLLRQSQNDTIRQFFTNALTKCGVLEVNFDHGVLANTTRKARWGAALVKEANQKSVSFALNFSQTKKMRTIVSVYRAVCLEVLKSLSIGAGKGGTHFVRCIRSDLIGQTRGFHPDIVRQQLRALAIVDTAKARQKGYPYRVSFSEFIKRYKFLAFEYEENVDVSKENCRLLLIRLKMEGWLIGRSKVFLKYYNEEYLARLYETQVKKIVKVQSMMRAFLVKRRLQKKIEEHRNKLRRQETLPPMEENEAATLIQKTYKGYRTRKVYQPLIDQNTGKLDDETAKFILPYAQKWKNSSLLQVLLCFRAARYQDLVYFTQQVHFYNQTSMTAMEQTNHPIDTKTLNTKVTVRDFLGVKKPSVWKLPFDFGQLQYFDTSYMCDPYSAEGLTTIDDTHEQWDEPLRWRDTVASQVAQSLAVQETKMIGNSVGNVPFLRDPVVPSNEIKLSPQRAPIRPRSPAESPTKTATHEFEFQKPRLKQTQKVNPIKELEKISPKNDNEDAPFNFQSMLRKTNYSRESMKRSRGSAQTTVTISEYRPRKAVVIDQSEFDEYDEPNGDIDNVIFEMRPESRLSVKYPEEYEDYVPDVVLKTELVPGIFIQGEYADL